MTTIDVVRIEKSAGQDKWKVTIFVRGHVESNFTCTIGAFDINGLARIGTNLWFTSKELLEEFMQITPRTNKAYVELLREDNKIRLG